MTWNYPLCLLPFLCLLLLLDLLRSVSDTIWLLLYLLRLLFLLLLCVVGLSTGWFEILSLLHKLLQQTLLRHFNGLGGR